MKIDYDEVVAKIDNLHQRLLSNNYTDDLNVLDPIADSHLCCEALALLRHYREGLEGISNYMSRTGMRHLLSREAEEILKGNIDE